MSKELSLSEALACSIVIERLIRETDSDKKRAVARSEANARKVKHYSR